MRKLLIVLGVLVGLVLALVFAFQGSSDDCEKEPPTAGENPRSSLYCE